MFSIGGDGARLIGANSRLRHEVMLFLETGTFYYILKYHSSLRMGLNARGNPYLKDGTCIRLAPLGKSCFERTIHRE